MWSLFLTRLVAHVVAIADQNQLEKMVSDLSMGLSVMKHEQEYMEVRERIHRMSKNLEREVWSRVVM